MPSTGAFHILHTFKGGADGAQPSLGGIAADGSLYGATEFSKVGYGTLFKMARNAAGGYDFSTLYTFSGGADGGRPTSPPTVNPDGSLAGTATLSGQSGGTGTLYTYAQGVLTTLKTFLLDANGAFPGAPPYSAPSGTLFGTTAAGGIRPCPGNGTRDNGCGVIYRYTP